MPRVIAWLEKEYDRFYTSAVVIAQLAYWVRTRRAPASSPAGMAHAAHRRTPRTCSRLQLVYYAGLG